MTAALKLQYHNVSEGLAAIIGIFTLIGCLALMWPVAELLWEFLF